MYIQFTIIFERRLVKKYNMIERSVLIICLLIYLLILSV